MSNRAASSLRLAGLAGASLLLSACGVFSPVQTDYPYIPADGVDLTVPGLDLRNLVIVSDAQGSPGIVVGQAVNNGSSAVDVTFTVQGAQPAKATVPAFSGGSLSESTPVDIGAVPGAPGSLIPVTVTTAQAGASIVQVPVLSRQNYYQDLPTPTAPSASSSSSASPSPSASSSG